jgi:type 1 glutamine amidotransferase
VSVLLQLDETTYSGGGMGASHPAAWCHSYDGGRAWYTALGHTTESYADPLFLSHVLGGIQWAASVRP